MVAGLLAFALLAGGIALVVVGAEAVLDGLVGTARRLGVSTFFLTVLLSGIELENIAAGVAANLAGFPGAAAGTFLGGTTFMTLGVAGISAIVMPFHVDIPQSFLLWTAFAGIPLLVLAQDGSLSRLDGLALTMFFLIAMLSLHRATGALRFDQPIAETEVVRKRHPWAWLLGGLAILTIGGQLLGNGLQAVVARFGISPTLLGNTAVAAVTEAEEIGRVLVPARRGRADIAAANIGGTAIHFLSLNAGIVALVAPLRLDDETMKLHLLVAVAAPAVFCLILLVRHGFGRLEGSFLLALYMAYIVIAVSGG